MKRFVIILLILAGALLSISLISRGFDGDFGWHLRFGQQIASGHFPYTDSYTWSYAGLPYVNHEWGSDLIFWFVYHTVGYNFLVILIGLAIWTAFVLAIYLGQKKLTPSALFIAMVALWSISYILLPRSTVIAPLFSILLLLCLEKIPGKKYYYAWPALFWIWAAMHGSWILGFIIIAIYLVGNAGAYFLTLRWPQLRLTSHWSKVDYKNVAVFAGISLLATLLNPYGFGLWREVFSYFSTTYYQQFINEWLPSYTYPIFWIPLIIGSVVAALAILGIVKRRLTLPQFLLFAAFFYSAWRYKRNMIYLMLIAVPILAITLEEVKNGWRRAFPPPKKTLVFFGPYGEYFVLVVFILFSFGSTLHLTQDVWHDQALLSANGFPLAAAEFLVKTEKQTPVILFNEFRWGGFLDWMLPNVPLYIDGRGTATWRLPSGELLFQKYRALRFDPGGLAAIEQTPANFILLQRDFTGYSGTPDAINRFIFGSNNLPGEAPAQPTQLENDLATSHDWKLVYQDPLALIWQRIVTSTVR